MLPGESFSTCYNTVIHNSGKALENQVHAFLLTQAEVSCILPLKINYMVILRECFRQAIKKYSWKFLNVKIVNGPLSTVLLRYQYSTIKSTILILSTQTEFHRCVPMTAVKMFLYKQMVSRVR